MVVFCPAFGGAQENEPAVTVFLHYDDARFGLRLKREGIESVVWPGVAVWRTAFTGKRAAGGTPTICGTCFSCFAITAG